MLFEDSSIQAADVPPEDQPLAARMRPASFAEYAGQQHIIGPGKMLRRAIEADTFTSVILHGPPGVGKTTLAELISTLTASHFERLSAVTARVADVREAISHAVRRRRHPGKRTILFIDEIHRFSRSQQDVLLPDVEKGVIRLIGATTENPFFQIVGPLISRSQVFRLEPLSADELRAVAERAISDPRGFPDLTITLRDDAMDFLVQVCEGDARRLLTALELAVNSSRRTGADSVTIDLETAAESIQQKALNYGDDGHYDTASALIKSMRGSDPDAAVYWLAKMLEAGEDILFIARRIVIFAAEDVGNADPRALSLATSAMQAIHMIGLPESRIILSQAVTYCATCPKSNAAIKAIDKAIGDIRKNRVQPVPMHLRDAHSSAGRQTGSGEGYKYPHDFAHGVVDQDYLTVPAIYYEPANIGYEARLGERLEQWRAWRRQQQGMQDAGGKETASPGHEAAPGLAD